MTRAQGIALIAAWIAAHGVRRAAPAYAAPLAAGAFPAAEERRRLARVVIEPPGCGASMEALWARLRSRRRARW